MKQSVICTICSKDYLIKPYMVGKSKYCSIECKNMGMRGRPAWNKSIWAILNCKTCNKEYSVKPYQKYSSQYCSKVCHAKGTLGKAPRTKERYEKIANAIRGIKRSPETIEKNRKAKTGIKQSAEQIAKRVAKNMGQKRSEEVKCKMSRAALKVPLEKRARGEKCARWKGGITPENNKIRTSAEYVRWRKDVFRRDKWTCRECGYRGNNLNADHVKPFSLFPELRFDVDNGKTLCESCHKKTPTYGTKMNSFTREDFLKEAI